MLLAALLLALAAGDAAAPIPLAPAPGAAPAASIVLGGKTFALDARGRGQVPGGSTLAAPGLRFYRLGENGPAFYLSASDTLVTWRLGGIERASTAGLVVKGHAAVTWEHAAQFEAPVEITDGRARVRFALPPGEWDVAILAKGYAPAFASKVAARDPSMTLAPAALQRAARVRGRILSARAGKPPEHWIAHVTRSDRIRSDDETAFFATWPIAVDQASLDFASIPVGTWELRVELPEGSRRRQAFTAPKRGATTDLGDVVIQDVGAVRLTLEFPVELPRGEVTVRLKGISNLTHAVDIDLASTTVRPTARTVVELAQVEPGFVLVECEAAASGIRRQEGISVRPGETAEASLTFVPATVHGVVKRGEQVVPHAVVSSPLDGSLRAITATADDFGEYTLKLWVSSEQISLTTLPPGDETHFIESVPVDAGATDVAHDVSLPTGEIRGVVRDAETGTPIAGADVAVSTSPDRPGETKEPITVHSSVMTDREGKFVLRNLSSRRVDVSVQNKGYAPSRFPGIEATPEGRELDVRLQRGLRLHGIVTDESGNALPGAIVGLDPNPSGVNFARISETSGSGEFEFRATDIGPHVLEILECGFTMEIRSVEVRPSDDLPGEAIQDVPLVRELDVLNVHLEDDAGTALDGVTLQWTINGVILPLADWQRFAEGCGHPIRSDTDGNLVLHGLPRGTIGAVAPMTTRPLGSFNNDGTRNEWTIRIPKEP